MKNNSFLIFCAVGFTLLAGCGAGKPEEDASSSSISNSSAANSTTLSLGTSAASFTVPESDTPYIKQPASTVLSRELTESQSLLSAGSALYPFWDLMDYQTLLPHPELFCEATTNAEFLSIAEQLGGFRKGSSIRIEKDATSPRVQSGLMVPTHFGTPDSPKNSSGGVTVQRPDVVGTSGSKAFYLSDTYGLITLDYASLPFSTPSPSCAFAIPGSPQNFVITDTHLYAIVAAGRATTSAVLQFDISGEQPEYVSGTVFENQSIIDARLFNDTLALYLRTYEVDESQPLGSDNNGASNDAQGSAPYPVAKLLGYELRTLQTKPTLQELSREALVGEGVENPPLDSTSSIEDVHRYSNFNSFLSASGEYLVVTESINERHFQRYEQRSYYRCDEYERHEYQYTSCHTKWKRVENPDYVPTNTSGVLECGGDLVTCLKDRLPSVNRYVYVNDGQECSDRTRYRHSCLSGQTVTNDYPVFNYQSKTKFTVFRFEDDDFVRLDDTLASLDDGDIVISDRPFEVTGRVQKHDHIQFHGDYLYVISGGNWSSKQSHLTTLAVMGNSAMEASIQTLNFDNGEINAAFSDDRIYISTNISQNSSIATYSLSDPLHPTATNTAELHANVEQLLHSSEGMIGIGRVRHQIGNQYVNFGSVTAFSDAGTEQDNLLLGTDYRGYNSPIHYDDQVLSFNALWQRLILPYNVYQPLPGVSGPLYANRVSFIKSNGNQLQSEATFDLPQTADRSLQLDDSNALVFSANFIHHMSKDDSWAHNRIFDGAIPQSIYYSRQHPIQVQYYVVGNELQFVLIDSADKASGDLLDSKTLERSASNVCTNEQVLFDRDRILVVREKAGLYISHEDCPADRRRETEKEYIGYRINQSSLEPINDEDELAQLYIQAGWNLICVTDTDELGGEVLDGYTLNDVEDLTCFTQDQFYDHVYSVLDELPAQQGDSNSSDTQSQ